MNARDERSAGVFLDRDNTLIVNDGDLGDPDAVVLLPGAAQAVRTLREAGFTLVVVTNQGGVARGKYTEADVEAVHRRCEELLARESEWTGPGPLVSRWMYCPFHPEATVEKYRREHSWRKPAPGMLTAAATECGIDLSQSWMVGDQERDVAAGRAAGCKTLLVHESGTTRNDVASASAADFVEPNIFAAARRILRATGRDGARQWTQTSAARLLAQSDALTDPRVRQKIIDSARGIARSQGVTLLCCHFHEGALEVEIIGGEFVALGLVAELRRATMSVGEASGFAHLWIEE